MGTAFVTLAAVSASRPLLAVNVDSSKVVVSAGIQASGGQTFSVSASGTVNLSSIDGPYNTDAYGTIVSAPAAGTGSAIFFTNNAGPIGVAPVVGARKLLISPYTGHLMNAPYGALVAGFSPKSDAASLSDFPTGFMLVGTGTILVAPPGGGYLFFAVNDYWPADNAGSFSVNVSSASSVTRSGVLSHIAAGRDWTTVITLVNNSPSSVPVTVALHTDDGSALTLPVTTTQQGRSATSTTSSINATINSKATLLLSIGGSGSTVVGWADVLSSGPLGGFAIFRQTGSTGQSSEGTVPLQTQFPTATMLAYDNTSDFLMGVALANLSASPATVAVTIWDDSGNQLGTQNLPIPGNGHTAFVLPHEFAQTAGTRGIIQFQSGGGIAGLGLRFSPFGTFTSVPTI